MDKATATPHLFRAMKSHRGKHNQTDMGAIAIIFIPISKLRSLTLEDNINNTFRNKYKSTLTLKAETATKLRKMFIFARTIVY